MSGRNLESDLGLFSEPFKTPAVPKAFMKTMKSSEENFNKEIKKYAHATAGEKIVSGFAKISNAAKKSKTYQKNEERKKMLTSLFQARVVYYQEAEKFFTGCKGVDEIKKYNKKIQDNYYNLIKKIYLNAYVDCSRFPREKYDLSFINDCPPPKTKDIYFKKFDAYMPYKSRCELLYSYLQTLFSTCLSAINISYNKSLEKQKNISAGTEGEFANAIERLNDSIRKYEECVKSIRSEVDKHKLYYNLGDNKFQMRKINYSIETTRDSLQSMISKAKRINLNAQFASIGTEDKQKYTKLMNTLASINQNLNNICKSISDGDYEILERDYEYVVESLNKLPRIVEDFNTAGYYKKKDFDEKLESYHQSLEKMMEKIDSVEKKITDFKSDFKDAYDRFKEQVVRISIRNTVATVMKIAGKFIPLSMTLGEWSNDFKAILEHSSLPTLK